MRSLQRTEDRRSGPSPNAWYRFDSLSVAEAITISGSAGLGDGRVAGGVGCCKPVLPSVLRCFAVHLATPADAALFLLESAAAVRILVTHSLPRTRGIAEVDLHVGGNRELSMVGKLHTAIPG